MGLEETLSWPFFDDGHRRFAEALGRWADATLTTLPHADLDAACRARVKALGDGGFLKAVVPAEHGGLNRALDVRTLCLARDMAPRTCVSTAPRPGSRTAASPITTSSSRAPGKQPAPGDSRRSWSIPARPA